MLNFINAYLCYKKIMMHPTDEAHTSFYTNNDILYYKGMPFRLINAEVTYQRMVNKLFKSMLSRNMEAYVDDTLIKYTKFELYVSDLHKTFEGMCSYNIRLNPTKCAFGVQSAKLLGFMVNKKRIEENP